MNVRLALGTIIVVAFGGVVVYMFMWIGVGETQWARMVYLFGGVEAIAFAATGFMFGKEVHREQAEKAETRADDEKTRADNADTRGRQLAEAIRTLGHPDKLAALRTLGPERAHQITQTDLNLLMAKANQLFPPA
jgi:hypothetical protein